VPTPAQVLAAMLASDPGRPRLTCYDDSPGSTHGERVELSARVLANWVAKAGNMLQDDLDGAPATTVGLDLPAHWRAFYWALAAWSVGATVVVGNGADTCDTVVTTDHQTAAQVAEGAGLPVLVTLPMLAAANLDAPPDVVDEARELANYGDAFAPNEDPNPDDPALVDGDAAHSFRDVVLAQPDWGANPRVRVPDDLHRALLAALSAWGADGSVVLVRQPDGDQSRRLAAENITVDIS
jgi:uncharacterized protein (TIGR03089 family)